ncbi:hypothetical protein WJX72_011472 [[Myrmecia] bisecta]|uniref:Major facilitator superfamily (MFS) profile domain-containing protein n=1 Tax=[Myrmecia] bisecta TaxID=41462 RepID=A0AAW1R9Q1_9CHLO
MVVCQHSAKAGRSAIQPLGVARLAHRPCSPRPQKCSTTSQRLGTWKSTVAVIPLKTQTKCHRRGKALVTQAVFDCARTQGGAVESFLRGWKALALQLMRSNVQPDNRQDIVRLVICMSYLIEINLWVVITAALPAMVQDASIAFAAGNTGTLLALGTLGSTVGKVLAASFMDSVDPKPAMVAVLLGVAALNSVFALGNSLTYFCATWFLGRVIHASGWVASTRLICQWSPEDMRGAALGSLAFSARVGFTCGGALLGAILLGGVSWRWLFHITSSMAVVIGAILYALVPADAPYSLVTEHEHSDYFFSVPRDNRPKVALVEGDGRVLEASSAWGRSGGSSAAEAATPSGSSTASSRGEALREFARSPQVVLAVVARCLLHVVLEFQAFLNLWAQQTLHISAGAAAQVAAGFSLGSAVSVLAGGFLYCRLQAAGRRNFIVALCAACVASFWGLLTVQTSVARIALIIGLGAALSIPYYVPLPAFSLRRGGNYSAVLEGVTETAAFASAACFDLTVGRILGSSAGWHGVLSVLMTFAAASTVIMAVFMQMEKSQEEQLVLADA